MRVLETAAIAMGGRRVGRHPWEGRRATRGDMCHARDAQCCAARGATSGAEFAMRSAALRGPRACWGAYNGRCQDRVRESGARGDMCHARDAQCCAARGTTSRGQARDAQSCAAKGQSLRDAQGGRHDRDAQPLRCEGHCSHGCSPWRRHVSCSRCADCAARGTTSGGSTAMRRAALREQLLAWDARAHLPSSIAASVHARSALWGRVRKGS